jgi:hypothetical protein
MLGHCCDAMLVRHQDLAAREGEVREAGEACRSGWTYSMFPTFPDT